MSLADDNRTKPMRSMLIDGTVPEYEPGRGASGQSILPGLLVYKSGTIPDNQVTVCDAAYGDAVKSEATIYSVEVPRSHPSFPKSWDIATAFTALTDTFRMHRLSVGDRLWLKGSSVSADEKLNVICAADGLVALPAGTTTIDVQNVHNFRVIGIWATATWIQGEYMGRKAFDNSA